MLIILHNEYYKIVPGDYSSHPPCHKTEIYPGENKKLNEHKGTAEKKKKNAVPVPSSTVTKKSLFINRLHLFFKNGIPVVCQRKNGKGKHNCRNRGVEHLKIYKYIF
jgi:hypothetical protein